MRSPGKGIPVFIVRVALPATILVVGLLLLLVHGAALLGVMLILIAVVVWVADLLFRLGNSSQDDRDREEQARQEFARTGRWPRDS
jgi:hypothetical protein